MKSLIAMAGIALTGCTAMNGVPTLTADVPDHIENATHKMTNVLMEGSYVVLNDEWAITVAHNKPIIATTGRTAIYHDQCDVALIKTRFGNTANTKLGYTYHGDTVHASGYPMFYMPMAYDEWHVMGDSVANWRDGKCVYTFADGVMIGGMSGGGVWNKKGQLVGVNVGTGHYKEKNNVAVFLPLAYVADWIYQNTGINLNK